ncbi:MAG: hypothetical protein B7Z72_07335 [Gemmatimonadetes bacterium 21-71-4]|nr:MAG: hypothetical protein B7Z72_07335 [Gemmatimonadetes bacterium 21-71-4]
MPRALGALRQRAPADVQEGRHRPLGRPAAPVLSVIAAVALGSNLGDRAGILARAREAIGRLPGARVAAASEVEETAPLGPVAQEACRSALEQAGFAVRAAADGHEALSLLASEPVDVLLTDVRMPRVGGRAFYEQLSRDAPEAATRVVFSTGDTVRDDTLAFLERAGRPVLHKPFKLVELRQVLASALAGRQ